MKKLENFLKGDVLIKEKTHMIIGGAGIATTGCSKQVSKDKSASGTMTFDSDSIDSAGDISYAGGHDISISGTGGTSGGVGGAGNNVGGFGGGSMNGGN